jgi:hypothetical protein
MIKVKVLERMRTGDVVTIIGTVDGNLYGHRYILPDDTAVGLAARPIKQGELIQFNLSENTKDIIVMKKF